MKNPLLLKKHECFALNDTNKIQILVPPNFVDGYLCMSKKCIFYYKMTESFTEHKFQKSVYWNDPELNVYWPIKNPILSERDFKKV